MLPIILTRRIPDTVDRVFFLRFPEGATSEQMAMISLRYIRAMIREGSADPLVRAEAEKVAGGRLAARETIERIHRWVQQRMRYEYDPPGIEMLTGARQALEAALKHGRYTEDCDGMVILEASMLRHLLGAPNVRVVIIKANKRDPSQWTHIFLQAKANGEWITVDPIMNGEDRKRPKKPVGWHPPRYYEKRHVAIGGGPGVGSMAAGDGMQTLERGKGMNNWIPAQKGKGNAIAYEDDGWFDRLPELADRPQPDDPNLYGIGAVMSHQYAQRSIVKTKDNDGLGAILSNVYAQGGSVPGYRPITVGEDPMAATGTPYWESPGIVGGCMRSQAAKTGMADYVQFGQQSEPSPWATLADTIVQASAGVYNTTQLARLNRERLRAGLPPFNPSQVGLGEKPAGTVAAVGIGTVAVVGTAALVAWSIMRRKRRRA